MSEKRWNTSYEPDSQGRINTESDTRKQAFHTAKYANDIPLSQASSRQYMVKDKNTNENLRQWEYTNTKGQKIDIREDRSKIYANGGTQNKYFNAGESGSKLNKQHHYYDTK
ncbi:unnamed protein product [Adineta steineri]|uniref:Uncharacterized protein n=1 Tax=Adineta steineri TaxID=433720 RepID=A0A815BQB9_9BILA|nr:unnamed protein product [Adineta steineri]